MAAQYDQELLESAVRTVLTDEGFKIPTENAQRAGLVAYRLLKWMQGNEEEEAKFFASQLLESIRTCCTHDKAVSCHKFRELMWEKYHKLCTSDDFKEKWTKFLESTIGIHSVIFYQFVTKYMFEEVIRTQFPLESSLVNLPVAKLDYEESNALRYCAGYILRSVKKKIDTSAHPMKKELLLCVEDLFENNADDGDADGSQSVAGASPSSDWTLVVNRGGLIMVNELIYNFFLAIEQEIRRHVNY